MNSTNSQHDSLTILVKSGLNLAGEDVLHQASASLLWDSPINYDANEEHITEREEMLNISLMETFWTCTHLDWSWMYDPNLLTSDQSAA